MKTGILGGTFNPIHNQHLALAVKAHDKLMLDKVLIMPSGISYFKKNTGVLPAETRYRMCCLAADEFPYLEVSDIEIRRSGNTYTYETLEEIKRNEPSDELFFIIGSDTLFSLKSWKCPDKVFSQANIVVFQRPEGSVDVSDKILDTIEEYKETFDAHIILLDIDISDISSSMIREKAAKGEDISMFVPRSVAEYIKENGLYHE